jgi:hypothetical protein
MLALLVAVAIGVTLDTSCGPPPKQPLEDPFFAEDAPSPVSSNFDDAETKWRKEVEHQRRGDPDALLTDDPPGKPDEYGNVAQEEPKTFWERVKRNSETWGKITFAAMSVLVTLGMMAAPYLLM